MALEQFQIQKNQRRADEWTKSIMESENMFFEITQLANSAPGMLVSPCILSDLFMNSTIDIHHLRERKGED